MKIALKTWAKVVIPLAVFPVLAGCATVRPPAGIQNGIRIMNSHMPEYVEAANKALDESDNPDKKRLIGMGERLQAGLDALDRWANSDDKDKKEDAK